MSRAFRCLGFPNRMVVCIQTACCAPDHKHNDCELTFACFSVLRSEIQTISLIERYNHWRAPGFTRNDRGTSRPAFTAYGGKIQATRCVGDRWLHYKDDCNSFKLGGGASEWKNKTAAHGDMSRRDEEDIEVCSRSIDLWGSLFIDYYIVACQAFFLLFFTFFVFYKNSVC